MSRGLLLPEMGLGGAERVIPKTNPWAGGRERKKSTRSWYGTTDQVPTKVVLSMDSFPTDHGLDAVDVEL